MVNNLELYLLSEPSRLTPSTGTARFGIPISTLLSVAGPDRRI